MPLKPPAQRLLSALDLLTSIERSGDVAELTTLGRQLDGWLTFTTLIPLPTGREHSQTGFQLHADGERTLWLLTGGRVLSVPRDPSSTPQERLLSDAGVDLVALCACLRPAVLGAYLGGVRLEELTGVAVLAVVADLFSLAWEMDRRGRETVMRRISGAMRHADGWDRAALRLKAGFERGLSDRAPAVRAVAAQALARMACGLGPPIPDDDPARALGILFSVPHPDVQVATLTALAQVPGDVLAHLAPMLSPLIQDALVGPDAETRRLASVLQLRLSGSGGAAGLKADLESADPAQRLAALRLLTDEASGHVIALMPLVLDLASDPEPTVREASLAVLAPLLERETESVRTRVLLSLLASTDASLAHPAINELRRRPLANPEILETARAALHGPPANRPRLVELVADLVADAPEVATATDVFVEMLRHEDPAVRWAVTRRLITQPPLRLGVREDLLSALSEHLQDPVPSLRVEAARAILALGYPQGPDLVAQLSFDPEPLVRRGLLAVLRDVGASEAFRLAEQTELHVDRLLDLAAAGEGDARIRWAASLEAIAEAKSPRVPWLLVDVLTKIPPDTTDPFLGFAIEELSARVIESTGGGRELLRLCHHLLEPPSPELEHAARLAGLVAADDPVALDFLWTLYAESSGAASETARRALAGIGPAPKSRSVEKTLLWLLQRTDDPVRRDVLRTLLGETAVGG